MLDFFTDPAHVPLTQWLIAGATLVGTVIALIALFKRSRRGPGAVAKDHSFAAGRDQHFGDVNVGTTPETKKD